MIIVAGTHIGDQVKNVYVDGELVHYSTSIDTDHGIVLYHKMTDHCLPIVDQAGRPIIFEKRGRISIDFR